MPDSPPPIYIATAGPIQSYRTGKMTDGIITVGAADEKLKMLMERFEKGATEAGKDPETMPKMIQLKVSFAPTDQEAIAAQSRTGPMAGWPFRKVTFEILKTSRQWPSW